VNEPCQTSTLRRDLSPQSANQFVRLSAETKNAVSTTCPCRRAATLEKVALNSQVHRLGGDDPKASASTSLQGKLGIFGPQLQEANTGLTIVPTLVRSYIN
jgi:hypothetical protein